MIKKLLKGIIMRLTDKQLKDFMKDGFIILRNFADIEKCKTILDIAKRELEAKIEPIETEIGYANNSKEYRCDEIDYNNSSKQQSVIRRLRQVYNRDILFQEWMEDEKIRPILQQILNDKVVITTAHHNSIMTKMPTDSTPTRWHQDRRYWHYEDNNLISIWLALDDEYKENGILEFIPNSHKMTFLPKQFDNKDYFIEDLEDNIPIIRTKISTTLKRGDVIIFHSLLLHRAGKNSTNRAKISFVYTVKGDLTKTIPNTRSSKYKEISLPLIT